MSSWYSILDLLNWGPFQPNIERTSAMVRWLPNEGSEYWPPRKEAPNLSFDGGNDIYYLRDRGVMT